MRVKTYTAGKINVGVTDIDKKRIELEEKMHLMEKKNEDTYTLIFKGKEADMLYRYIGNGEILGVEDINISIEHQSLARVKMSLFVRLKGGEKND